LNDAKSVGKSGEVERGDPYGKDREGKNMELSGTKGQTV
jgi:hypothetical protein